MLASITVTSVCLCGVVCRFGGNLMEEILCELGRWLVTWLSTFWVRTALCEEKYL